LVKSDFRWVIALVATKGGAGKTTIAACLAGEWGHRGQDVALLDADPQRTLSAWHAGGGPLVDIPIGAASGASVDPALQGLMKQHALVIVDTAGFANRDTLAVLRWADVALVPFGPSPADALGAAQTIKLLRDVNATVERQRTPVQILMVMNGASRGAMTAHIRGEVERLGMPVLAPSVHRRQIYAEAMLSGSAPCWMGSGAKAAAAEIAALADACWVSAGRSNT